MELLLTPCREYQGRRKNGYGWHWRRGYMHRWVARQAGLGIDGLEVMHLCDNKPCFRLDHLQVGTHAENMRQFGERGSPNHPKVRLVRRCLTPTQEASIRERIAHGEVQRSLAAEFGVDPKTITNIKRRTVL